MFRVGEVHLVIASIHQPHFLPWMGYLNKVLHSDVFIWLHNVQYRVRYYQNRALIKNVNEESLWLTIPVHAKRIMNIDEVTIADPMCIDRVCRTFQHCYAKTPFFKVCWPRIECAMRESSKSLDDLNYRTFRALLELVDGKSVRIERAADLAVKSEDATERLVELCVAVGANRYIAGRGGHNYMLTEKFDKAGVKILWQEFEPDKVVYKQLGNKFVSGLSVVDCLFNEGPARTRELILSAWTP